MSPLLDRIGALSRRSQWLVLILVSAITAAGLEFVHLPAALLLGPMIGGILIGVSGSRIRMPAPVFALSQALVGCLIAAAITPAILHDMLAAWPIFAGGVLSVVVAAAAIGAVMTVWQILPGTTAVWGASPGAATAMVVMAEAYGGDMRLVAMMQYIRVLLVAGTASLVARLVASGGDAVLPDVIWFPPIHPTSLAGTLAVVAVSPFLGVRLRIPAGAFITPLAVAIPLQAAGWLTIDLPPWLLALAYAVVGWSIGLRFTRPILAHAARLMPRIVLSSLVLIAICAGYAVILAPIAGVDLLTAYLATSPGGADSIAIISASSPVDVPFVMAMQTTRLIVLLLSGPAIARLVAGWLDRRGQPAE